MACGCRWPAARKNELLEPRQIVVESIEIRLQAIDKRLRDSAMSGYAELATQFEQVVLDLGEAVAHPRRQRGAREYHSYGAVGLIDRAIGFDTRTVFRRAAAVAESGCAVIAGTRVYLAQSISHGATIGSGCKAVKKRAGQASPRCLFREAVAAIVQPVNTFDENSASAYLKVALAAASKAAEISRSYYAGNFTVTTKEDMTPVTQADVECEEAIREIILDAFPDHGFYGEETGRTQEDAEFLWLVDPIDGTKGFVRQYPFFSTQIALMHDGEIVLGVSSGTMMDELAWAEKGQGAWLNGKPLNISRIDNPDLAAVSVGNLKSLAGSGGWGRLGGIVERADRIRGYGDFYHYHLLAAGKIEAVIESDVNILDIAALSIIVTEAGGVFTNLNGERPTLEIRSVLAANPSLHAEYLELLRGYVS